MIWPCFSAQFRGRHFGHKVNECVHPDVILVCDRQMSEHIQIVVGINANNSVNRVVTTVCRHCVVRSAIGSQGKALRCTTAEPVFLEVVAIVRRGFC